jgi:hypothetical protein
MCGMTKKGDVMATVNQFTALNPGFNHSVVMCTNETFSPLSFAMSNAGEYKSVTY